MTEPDYGQYPSWQPGPTRSEPAGGGYPAPQQWPAPDPTTPSAPAWTPSSPPATSAPSADVPGAAPWAARETSAVPYGSPYPPPQYGSGAAPANQPWQPPAASYLTPTPSKRRFGAGALVAVAAVTAVVCGLGGAVIGAVAASSDSADNKAATVTPTSAESATSTPAPSSGKFTGSGKDLLALIPAAPADARIVKPSHSTGGVMTLDQFIAAYYPTNPTEKDRLTARAFQVAAVRYYVRKGVEVDSNLAAFGEDSGSESYVTAQIHAFSNDTRVGGKFDIPGVDNAKGFEFKTMDKYGDFRCVMIAQVNNVTVVMDVFTPGKFDRAANIKLMTDLITSVHNG